MHHAFHLYNTKKAAIYNRFQLVPSLFVNISFTKKVGKKCRGTRQVINYQLFLVVKSFIAWCHSCHASFCQKNNEAFNCRETKYRTNSLIFNILVEMFVTVTLKKETICRLVKKKKYNIARVCNDYQFRKSWEKLKQPGL